MIFDLVTGSSGRHESRTKRTPAGIAILVELEFVRCAAIMRHNPTLGSCGPDLLRDTLGNLAELLHD